MITQEMLDDPQNSTAKQELLQLLFDNPPAQKPFLAAMEEYVEGKEAIVQMYGETSEIVRDYLDRYLVACIEKHFTEEVRAQCRDYAQTKLSQ